MFFRNTCKYFKSHQTLRSCPSQNCGIRTCSWMIHRQGHAKIAGGNATPHSAIMRCLSEMATKNHGCRLCCGCSCVTFCCSFLLVTLGGSHRLRRRKQETTTPQLRHSDASATTRVTLAPHTIKTLHTTAAMQQALWIGMSVSLALNDNLSNIGGELIPTYLRGRTPSA